MMQEFGPLTSSADSRRRIAVELARRFGFWGSVILPLAYLPVLYVMSGSARMAVLTVLVSLNVACLVAGHRYSP